MTRTTAALAAMMAAAAIAIASGCASDPDDSRQAQASGPNVAGAEPTAQSNDPAAVAPNGIVVEVLALDNSFRDDELTVAAGTEVVFRNVGRNEHNVIPDPKSIQGWGVSETEFAPKGEYAHVFAVPGVYAYVCTIHGVKGKGMVGTITVTA